MKQIIATQEVLEILAEKGISVVCDEQMRTVIAEDDIRLIPHAMGDKPWLMVDYTIAELN